MKLTFFTIPVLNPVPEQRALNAFLGKHRVVNIDRHLVTEHGQAMWALCVTYLEGPTSLSLVSENKSSSRERVDYKEILSPDEFRVYSQLREVRKAISQEAGIPLYSVFTNEQLAAMVRGRMQTKAELQAIEGVGQARIDKYADAFSKVLREAWPERTASSEV